MSEDHPNSAVAFTDSTFSIEDDDECVLEEDDECVIDEDECVIDEDESGGNGVAGLMMTKTVIDQMVDGDDSEELHELHIHDQLPSVEEIKSSQAYIPTAKIIAKSNRKKQRCIAAGVVVATIIIILIAVVAVAATSRVDHIKNNKNNAATFTAFVNTDVNLADGDPDSPISGNLAFESRVDAVNDYLWKNNISSLPSLIEPGTPEHFASVFMAVADNYHSQMVPGNEQHFIERYILALLYYGMNGADWTTQYDFLHAKDYCLWTGYSSTPAGSFVKGVECNEEGYVMGLDLSNNNLQAHKIPTELQHLLHLEKLHLQHNELGGTIPDLSLLSHMKSIGLMDTGITGSIPDWIGTSWGNSLTTFGLSKNGEMSPSTIPTSFTQLVHLEVLALDGMNVQGTLDPIKGLTSLIGLYVEDNMLTGTLEGNSWTHIVELDVSGNMLSGSIPKLLLQRSQLQIVDLNRNLFTGEIPQDILMNDALQYISMHVNSLTGQLSDRIGYLTNLKHLDVGGNVLTGTLPDTIKQLTNLVTFSTAGNEFTPALLYDYFSGMPHLEDLSLKANHLMGTLPPFLGELTSLVLLDLDANDFWGTIPQNYGSLTNLHALLLNRNDLTGTIPTGFQQLSHLKVLLLDKNSLQGSANQICVSPLGMQLQHFITDCYPGKGGMDVSPPEIECRCCTLCCNDDDLECNNKNWMMEKDYNALYGSMQDAYYLFGVDKAPEGWAQKAIVEARRTVVPAVSSTNTAVP